MRRRRFLGLAVAAAWVARPKLVSASRTGSPQEDRKLESIQLIERKMAEYRIPGVGFGLSKNGETVLRGFGITNIDNPQPVTPDTVFPIASISKTVVTTAVMRLVEQGGLDLEAPVRAYIPDFSVQDALASGEVRLWHLLTHTPGWEGQLRTPNLGDETLAHFTEGLRDLPQLATPGTVWSYNNAGFGVAGRILELGTSSTIHDALSDLVFEPVRLTRAFTRTGTAMTHRFAVGHRERSGETEVVRPFRLPANVPAGGAAMSLSSLLDYARFHLGDGKAGGGRVLSQASLEQMRTPRLQKNSTSDEMGLGWQLRRLEGVLTAAHGGTLGGHCLHIQLVLERNLAFAILTNHNFGWRLIQDVERAILEAYEALSLAPNQATGGNRGGNESSCGRCDRRARDRSGSSEVRRHRRRIPAVSTQRRGICRRRPRVGRTRRIGKPSIVHRERSRRELRSPSWLGPARPHRRRSTTRDRHRSSHRARERGAPTHRVPTRAAFDRALYRGASVRDRYHRQRSGFATTPSTAKPIQSFYGVTKSGRERANII